MAKKPVEKKEIKVLQSIFFLKNPTRNEIADHTGMSPVSVTALLNRLAERGLVERSGKTQTRSGRPSALYRLCSALGCCMGISVDTGSFRIAAVDPRHEIACSREFVLSLSSVPADHLGDIIKQMSLELRRFLELPELKGRRPLAIGLALPGMVDTARGVWLHGLQVSGITHIALQRMIEQMFGLPVVVEDVARCLAYLHAERRWPGDSDDLVFLYLGSGVGAGIIIGGEPYLGVHGLAGEVGHLVVEEEGERCSCGNIGCLETVVSVPSILRRFRRRLSEGVISSLQRFRGAEDAPLTLEAIREAASSGDRLAQSTLFEIGTFLGDACGKIIKLYNPRTFVIGGTAAMLGDFLREPILLKIRQKVIPEMLEDFTFEIAATHPVDEPLGAALLAERRFWKNAPGAGVEFG
jgi:N-acetylglucosamine repressor